MKEYIENGFKITDFENGSFIKTKIIETDEKIVVEDNATLEEILTTLDLILLKQEGVIA